MNIHSNYPLISHNTFAIDVKTNWWIEYESLEDLSKLSRDEFFQQQKFFAIGQGSNILFTQDFNGVILSSKIEGIETIEDTEAYSILKIGSGIIWDDFVHFSLKNKLFGLENLSLIPGTVGAASIQNIGAYGTEIKDFIHSIQTFDLEKGEEKTFFLEDCKYDYRYSIFKEPEYKKYIITYVLLKLKKEPKVNIAYQALQERFNSFIPTPQELREAIIEIRESKLPSPQDLPNAGSFFKNPIVSLETFQELKKTYPSIVNFPNSEGVKLSAAWLIDQCGLKGFEKGNVATYSKQALVIVNKGGASGDEIKEFATFLSKKVKEKFGVVLEPEVNYIN